MSNAFGNLIGNGEGGYNSFNRGSAGDAGGKTIDFSTMTLAEVQAAQHLGRHDPDRLFAVGKYQIIPDTMDHAVSHLHLDASQKFTPELQERIFADYLIAEKRPAIEAYIKGAPGATLHSAQKAACMEWASIDDPDTPGKPFKNYIGTGNNHSSIRASQVGDALNQMRIEYKANIAKGMKPDEAWRAVTGSDGAPTQTHSAPHHVTHTHPASHGALAQGDHGPTVSKLQTDLYHLGYTDAHSKPLHIDGHFGPATQAAVEVFQRDHHLMVDGKAGPKTLEALHAQTHAHALPPRLDSPKNPDHALYAQALAGVRQLDAKAGRVPDQHSANLAAALVVQAKKEGLTRIDQVALSTDDGARVFAVQTDAFTHKYAEVPTLASLNTPLDKSSAAALAMVKPPEPVMPPPTPTPTQSQGFSR